MWLFWYHPSGTQDFEFAPRILKNLYTLILSIFEHHEILLSTKCANYSNKNEKDSALQNLVKKLTDHELHGTLMQSKH
jgi:hypothetical protein